MSHSDEREREDVEGLLVGTGYYGKPKQLHTQLQQQQQMCRVIAEGTFLISFSK